MRCEKEALQTDVGCDLVYESRIDIHYPHGRLSSILPARLSLCFSVFIDTPDARADTISSCPTSAHSLAVFQVHWEGDTHVTSVD